MSHDSRFALCVLPHPLPLPNLFLVHRFNEQVTPQCATGFEVAGGTSVQPYTCTGPNTWSSGSISCRRVHCNPLSFPFATLTQSGSNNACETCHGSTCTATCNAGFLPATKQFQCIGGTWSPNTDPPACGCARIDATSVRQATDAAIAQVDRYATGSRSATQVGRLCSVLGCEPGFVPEGVLVCADNNAWTGRLRCVPRVRLKMGGSR